METTPMTIYTVLFLIAIIPILIGKKPFTYFLSKRGLPDVIINSGIF